LNREMDADWCSFLAQSYTLRSMEPVPEIAKQWLVCPVCKAELDWRADTVICCACRRVYPVEDEIPVLLRERAILPAE